MFAKLPRILLWHMKFFQLLGFFPIALNTECSQNNLSHSIRKAILRFWPIVLLGLFSTVTINTFTSNYEFLFSGDRFGYFNDALKIIMGQITITTIYMESMLNRQAIKEFWLLYKKITNQMTTFTNVNCIWRELKENWRFLTIFYGILTLEIIVLVVFIRYEKLTVHLILFWSMFYPYIYTVHFRNMQFILYMELIRIELENLKCELAELLDYARIGAKIEPFKGFSEFLRCKIQEKQLKHFCIYEMYKNFQHAYGVSISTVLLFVYVRVLVDAYFTYFTMYNDSMRFEFVLLFPALFQIPFFLITSMNCMNVVKYITFQLHNIMRKVDDIAISVQIQNFSLQILHLNININGIGIATMDGYMLTKAIGSVTTYMIFFIQFMPKFRHL